MNDSYRPGGASGYQPNVEAVVKWFNPIKGFGFVTVNEGSGDAFLHHSVLRQAGESDVTEGSVIFCDLSAGPRGFQVAKIHRVEHAAGGPPARPPGDDYGYSPEPVPDTPVEGTVKFFNLQKGFGFVCPDDGGRDIFVHAKILGRCGLETLLPQQRVRVTVRQGQKGMMAETVEVI